MNKTTLVGLGDDTIKLNGELSKEFSCYNLHYGTLAFSDGTLIRFLYDDGIWRFFVASKGYLYEKREIGDLKNYTNDKIYFKEGLKWCLFSKGYNYVLRWNLNE